VFLDLNRGFSLYEHTPKSPLERGLLECHLLNSVARFWATLVALTDVKIGSMLTTLIVNSYVSTCTELKRERVSMKIGGFL
jgi:hypothetical protein